MATNEFSWWNQALRGVIPDVIEDEPQSGYYRIRDKAADRWDPLAIWTLDGVKVALRGDTEVDPKEVWMWCCKYPVPYAAYVAVTGGDPWPFEIPREAGIGDNSGGLEPHAALGDRLTAIRTHADLWLQGLGGELKTQDDADKAAAYADRVSKLQKEADEAFTTEKKPWLEGGRAVDGKWRDVREACTANLRWLKELAGAWMKKEAAARMEAARKANEEAAAKAKAEGLAAPTAPVVQAAPVRAGARGTGRAVTMRKVERVEIDDLKALATYIAAIDNPPIEFREECRKIAHRLLKAGVTVPGARLVDDEVAA